MVKFKRIAQFFLIILSLSCAPSKKLLIEPNLEIALTKIRLRNANIKNLTADGKITIESSEYSNSANFELELKKPDTLFIKVKTIFGINIGEIKIYGDRFNLNDRFNDRILYGNVRDYMKKFLGLDLSTPELISLLLASPEIDKIEKSELNDEGFTIYTREAEYERIVKFSPEFEVESYILSKNGFVIFEFRYSKYINLDGVTLPRVVRIYDDSGRALHLIFSEIKIKSVDEGKG